MSEYGFTRYDRWSDTSQSKRIAPFPGVRTMVFLVRDKAKAMAMFYQEFRGSEPQLHDIDVQDEWRFLKADSEWPARWVVQWGR